MRGNPESIPTGTSRFWSVLHREQALLGFRNFAQILAGSVQLLKVFPLEIRAAVRCIELILLNKDTADQAKHGCFIREYTDYFCSSRRVINLSSHFGIRWVVSQLEDFFNDNKMMTNPNFSKPNKCAKFKN